MRVSLFRAIHFFHCGNGGDCGFWLGHTARFGQTFPSRHNREPEGSDVVHEL
jgi:hypothetical protein